MKAVPLSSDKTFRLLLLLCALVVPAVCIAIVATLIANSTEAFAEFGFFGFIGSDEWNVTTGQESYGAFSFLTGTVYTTFLALLICAFLALPIALFCGEYYRGKTVSKLLATVTSLLAGIPSIIYGLWGFFTLRPLVIALGLSDVGCGVLTASMVLAVMIVPYAANLSIEFIRMVPNDLKESAYSLGATRAEVIRRVVLPTAGAGIFSSFILAMGRAIGETMTVTMLIGNTNNIPQSVVDTGNSMASVIANQFGEADGLKLSALIAIGLTLFAITSVVNMIGKMLIKKARV